MLLHLVGFSSSLVTDTVSIKRRIAHEVIYDMYMSYIWYDFLELVVLRFLAMGERSYTTEQVKEYWDPPKFLAMTNFASNLCTTTVAKTSIAATNTKIIKKFRIIDSFEPLLPPDQNVISAEGALRIPMTYDNQSHPNLTYIIEDDLS